MRYEVPQQSGTFSEMNDMKNIWNFCSSPKYYNITPTGSKTIKACLMADS